MREQKTVNPKEEWGSMRQITILTPDTFTRKMIIVSTTWAFTSESGQTAVAQVNGLNYFDIDISKITKWNIIKKHGTFQDSQKFHNELVLSKKFIDCEEC